MRRIILLTALRRELRALPFTGPSAVIGVGGVLLPRLALAPDANTLVVLAGLAGALDPSLKAGDVVIDDRDHRFSDLSSARYGVIHSSDHLIPTPAAKAELFKQTGALVVDMEGAAVRRWAEQRGAAMVHLRAISDTADQVLDLDVAGLVDSAGRVRATRLLRLLVMRPNSTADLYRLQKQTAAALANLATTFGMLATGN